MLDAFFHKVVYYCFKYFQSLTLSYKLNSKVLHILTLENSKSRNIRPTVAACT